MTMRIRMKTSKSGVALRVGHRLGFGTCINLYIVDWKYLCMISLQVVANSGGQNESTPSVLLLGSNLGVHCSATRNIDVANERFVQNRDARVYA